MVSVEELNKSLAEPEFGELSAYKKQFLESINYFFDQFLKTVQKMYTDDTSVNAGYYYMLLQSVRDHERVCRLLIMYERRKSYAAIDEASILVDGIIQEISDHISKIQEMQLRRKENAVTSTTD